MALIKARFYCGICRKTITLNLDDEFQAKIKNTADTWPYPLSVPHDGHWTFVYLDSEFRERGVTSTLLEFKLAP